MGQNIDIGSHQVAQTCSSIERAKTSYQVEPRETIVNDQHVPFIISPCQVTKLLLSGNLLVNQTKLGVRPSTQTHRLLTHYIKANLSLSIPTQMLRNNE
jgi:hypothetical protein